jgi:predicted transposase YbfD/YdcC
MGWFAACFGDLPDPRTGNATRHNLLDLLTIALTASICGADSCVDFADFARDRAALFGEFLTLEGGLPSHDTFSRLFRILDPASFAKCFSRFVDKLGEVGAGVVAIDGKTMRRSFDRAADRSPLHVVTAFACERRLVLAQAAVQDKENEILAARNVLEMFDIKGMLVTADAMHCNAKTTRLIVDRGGDYVIALKANRPAMHKEVAHFFAAPPAPLASHTTVDNSHGRIETRRHTVCHAVGWLSPTRSESDEAPLAGLAMIGMIEATVEAPGGTSFERRYYVSSSQLTPERFAKVSRAHWAIENSLHWVLDTSFDEDRARNRCDHGPENLTILRKLALNILQSARPDISIRRKRKRSGWSDEFARTILGQMR